MVQQIVQLRVSSGVVAGSKILVVEDNYLLAEVVSNFVIDCGLEPVGPASRLETGLAYAREAPLDGAILDINLDGELCFPICAMLAERNIPFTFLTGYSELSIMPPAYRSVPVVAKPFDPEILRGVIEGMLTGRAEQPAHAASLHTPLTVHP